MTSLADVNEYRLVRDLLRSYDKRIRPSLNASHPLNVTFGFSLSQIIDVVSNCTFYWRILFNPFPNKSWFLRVRSTSLLKTLWEKKKLLVTSNFSLFHSVFYPFDDLSAIFIKSEIDVCNSFSSERV